MIKNRIMIGAVAASAVLVPVAGVSALTAGPAGAATKTITCTKAKGNIGTKMKFSGCSGNTGGGSKGFTAATLEGGGTIKWKSGKTTTFSAPTLGTGTNCAVGDTDITATGAVTGDTTGSAKPIPGTYSGEVCVDGSGNISLPAGHPLTAN